MKVLSRLFRSKIHIKYGSNRLQTLHKYSFCSGSIIDQHHKKFKWITTFPKVAYITDVGPRDGLQNEWKNKIIPAETKIKLINKLEESGIKKIECGSFVSPRWVPQMANSDEIFDTLHQQKLNNPNNDTTHIGLILNERGIEKAVDKNVKEVLYVLSASETFSQKNMNCSFDESYKRMEEIVEYSIMNDVIFRVVISCSLGCPYEGYINPQKVVDIISQMSLDYSGKEIDNVIIADTIGIGTAGDIYKVLDGLLNENDFGFDIGVHFHDTYGQALANILTSLSMGVNIIESSVGGLGGCPFAPGATGNVATEDIVYMLDGLGIETNVDIDKLMEASNFITGYLGKISNSRVTNAFNAKNPQK